MEERRLSNISSEKDSAGCLENMETRFCKSISSFQVGDMISTKTGQHVIRYVIFCNLVIMPLTIHWYFKHNIACFYHRADKFKSNAGMR